MNNFAHTLDHAFTYFLGHELSILTIAMFVFLFIFLLSWLIEPRRLFNGLLFTAFGLSFLAWFSVLIFSQNNKWLNYIFGFLALLVLLGIIFLVVFSWAFFLWNAYFVWKYESHTLPNLLTLFIGLGMVLIWILDRLGIFHNLPDWLHALLGGSIAIAVYLLIVMYNFLINLFLYQFVPRHYNQDYLIVLGAGLINGNQVSRLLGARIDRAISFARRQYDKGGKLPKIIMSGGQGPDEKMSEAAAMRDYAIARGYDSDLILLEDKSTNTYQNMIYSKKVAQTDCGKEKFKAKFFSNNYHIFRAGLYAKMAGLRANGVGAPTRLYFLPNAIIREFAGVFVMHKKRHFAVIGLIALIFIAQVVIILLHMAKFRII